jgi:hypothetical protein
MRTVNECCATEEQHSVLRFCEQTDLLQGILIKKYFLLTVGSVCRVKLFTVWRQKSKDFYAADFDALV